MNSNNDSESDDRPLTAEEILNVIRTQIRRLDHDTYTYVGDLGELDAVLATFHWLYATATGRLDEYCKASLAETERPEEFLRYKQLAESHEPVGETEGTRAILNRWKTRGRAIGLNSN
jgi:hypothetical protein